MAVLGAERRLGFVHRLPIGSMALLLTWMLMLPIGTFGMAQIVD